MRKLFATLLALVMVLSMSVGAFAIGNDSEGNPVTQPEGGPYIDVATVNLEYNYLAQGGSSGDLNPAETIAFDVAVSSAVDENGNAIANAPVPTAAIDIAEGALLGGQSNRYITLTGKIVLPEYETPGTYVYALTAKKGNVLGVQYNFQDDSHFLTVTVNRVNGELVRVAALRKDLNGGKIESTKTDLTATYSANRLTVENVINNPLPEDEGKTNKVYITFSNPTDKEMRSSFEYKIGEETVRVTADEWEDGKVTVTLDMTAGQQIVITDIPYGIEWSASYEELPAEEYEFVSFTNSTGTMGGMRKTITLTHNRLEPDTDIPVDTGIVLDSMPYVLMLAVAASGCVALVSKKRED